METTKSVRIYRFHDSVAIEIPGGKATMYFDVWTARGLAKELARYAENIAHSSKWLTTRIVAHDGTVTNEVDGTRRAKYVP